MEEDSDVTQERETKDFQFKQLKKVRVFNPPQNIPEGRSSLLAISNKYGLLFVGSPSGLKVFYTKDVLLPVQQGDDPNAIISGPSGIEVLTKYPVHHVALSSENLTLSVCTASSESGCQISFYDTRTLLNKVKQPKQAFASQTLLRDPSCFVTDLKWNPVASTVAVCLSDGSISVLQVSDTVTLYANLPAAKGVTSVCWSPKGKQLAVGKQDGTVVQYLPNLQEKKVIPCPPFYDSDNPVKVLDVIWISTYVFGVVYAAADGSLETSPQLVMVLLPKKEDKRQERFLNFTEICFSSSNVRQHHFFMNYMEDWDVLLAASAASIEVSVIAKLPDQNSWELWILEDSSRAELPVSDNSDDTLPMGVVVDYSNQQKVVISEEKILPPTPIMVVLSTDGVLCPFHAINLIPQAKSLITPLEELSMEGERQIKSAPAQGTTMPSNTAAAITPAFNIPVSSLTARTQPTAPAFSLATTASKPASTALNFGATTPFASKPPDAPQSFAPSTTSFASKPQTATPQGFGAPVFPSKPQSMLAGFGLPSQGLSNKPQVVSQPFGMASPAGKPSDAGGFGSVTVTTSIPTGFSLPAVTTSAPSGFSLPTVTTSSTSGFSLPSSSQGFSFSAQSNSAFGSSSSKPENTSNASQAASPGFGFLSNVKVNLGDKFGSADGQPAASKPAFATSTQSFPFTPPAKQTMAASALNSATPTLPPSQPAVTPSRPSSDAHPTASQKTQKINLSESKQQPLQLQANNPIMNAINEEIAQFQKEMDDSKSRTAKTTVNVGTDEEMRQLKTECDGLHSFVLEIKDTTESLHGDIDNLKTDLLDSFSCLLTAKELSERKKDRVYHRLLSKRPLDPKSEELMKVILTTDWLCSEDSLSLAIGQSSSLVVPQRPALFIRLSEHQEMITQQKQRLKEVLSSLQKLRLYNQTSQWNNQMEDSNNISFEDELEKLHISLSKIDMETKPSPKPQSKISKVKIGQLKNFLGSRKITRVRSLAPVNLSRSSFLAPSYFEDLNDVSSTSSLSEAGDNEEIQALPERVAFRQETPPPEPSPVRPARHAPVTRTASVQPGFGTPSLPFGKTQSQIGPMTSTPAVPPQSIRVIPQGADSTMLATKTVKHGAPPVTATQAAAAAALRRQLVTQVPASLTESTLQTVPQVVNVKELKGNGPGPTIPTVIGPSVPQSAAQVVNQVLVTVGSAPAKQVSAPSGIKAASLPTPPNNVTVQPGSGLVASKTGQIGLKADSSGAPSNKAFSFATPGVFTMGNVAPPAAAGSTLGVLTQAKNVNQPATFLTETSNKFQFGPATEANVAFGSPKPATTTTISPADSSTTLKQTASQSPPMTTTSGFTSGETLGSFSGLRVGQAEEASKPDTSKAVPSFQPEKVPVPTLSVSGGFQASKAAEATSTTNSSSGMLFGNKTQSTGLNKQPFSFTAPATTVPATEASTAAATTQMPFAGFMIPSATTTAAATSSVPTDVQQTVPEKLSDPAAPPSQIQALLATPTEGGKEQAPAFSSMLKNSVPSVAKPQSASEAKSGTPLASVFPTIVNVSTMSMPVSSSSQVPPASTATEGFSTQTAFGKFQSPVAFNPSAAKQPFSFTAPTTTTLVTNASAGTTATAPLTFAGVMLPSAALQPPTTATSAASGSASGEVKQPVPEKILSDPAAPPLQLQALLATPTEGNKEQAAFSALEKAVSSAPAAKSQPAAETKTDSPLVPPASTTPEGLPSQMASTLGLTSAQMTSASTGSTPVSAFSQPAIPAATSTTSIFGQVAATSTGASLFGQPSSTATSTSGSATSGFGAPAFGQAALGQSTSFWKTPASSSASGFSFSSGFGSQSVFGQTPASTATTSSSGVSLFGSSANSASSFSFGQQASTTDTSSSGGGVFGQSSTPSFGQSSTFGQSAPAFGSASSTTTTSSSGFSFGQQSGFGSVFGQSQNTGTSIFGQAAPSGGGLFGSSSTNTGGGAFFSGLGGKPSQEAANKNPFGTASAGFGAPSTTGSTNLFGNSGAKTFGFGNSSFGEQKSSGTFSGGGSVASQGFGFSSPTKTGGFGAAPVFGSPPTFGGSPGFGGVPAFGSAPSFTSPLGSTGGKVFGEGTAAANTGGFGFGSNAGTSTFGTLASQSTPTFGSLSQQGSGFGTQNSGFSGFGSGGSGTGSGSTGGFPFGVTNQSQPGFGGGWRG
ncbi:nuclear pore complex protein Nup214 [Gastrophryne carolinensis]